MNRAATSGPTPCRPVNVAAGGGDQVGDLPLQLGGLAVEGEHPLEPTATQIGTDAVIAADQRQRSLDPCSAGQIGDGVLVAGVKPAQLGVGPVR